MFYDNQRGQNKPIADSDLLSDDFFDIYDWIWESAREFAEYPQIRSIFIDDATWATMHKES
jgi:hypothetical protein